MRHLVPLLLLAATGCATPIGQKVTVLLSDRQIPCQSTPDGRYAELELDARDDLFQLSYVNEKTDEAVIRGARREGTTVIYACDDDEETLVVRHATILQARAE